MMDVSNLTQERLAVEQAAKFYQVLAKHVSGTTTVSELIVLTEVARGVYDAKPVTVSEISKSSGISRWRVSRIVARYVESGSLVETKDPNDCRRNLLNWTTEAFAASSEWAKDWNNLTKTDWA